MSKSLRSRILCLALAAVMVLGLFPTVSAAPSGLRWELTDQALSHDRSDRLIQENTAGDPIHSPTDMVRVSIVLEDAPTLRAGYSTTGITASSAAAAYDLELQKVQKSMEKTISTQALNGEPLDVVWNLTLACNIISANVPYGKLDAIRAVKGVRDVVIERQYTVDPIKPDTDTSSGITGSSTVWQTGLTGAGTRIAIIDTGTDTNHQSFNNGAFLYSLTQNAAEKGMDPGTYIDSLDLLDPTGIESVLTRLNAYERIGASAQQFYINEKLPFGANYVDYDLRVTHDADQQGSHGSHVAGIAAANRFIPQGNSYTNALQAVSMTGMAPDAQIITLKVFGNAAGPSDGDYFAAIEDAIWLGCDSINLSLGTGSPGYSDNPLFADLLEFMATTDTVVVMSSGNSGRWSDATTNNYLYDDGVNFQTSGAPGTYTNSLSVASVDNSGSTNSHLRIGDNIIVYTENLGYNNKPLTDLDISQNGSGTTYSYIFIDGLGYAEDYSGMDLSGKVVFCSRGDLNFADKANNAVGLGAAAVVVYNNTAGPFAMDLSGYYYTAPCVGILQRDADVIRSASTRKTTSGGQVYYTGSVTINKSAHASTAYYTLSNFSSWGVTGALEMKPEITAPGGMIWSVNGMDRSGTSYETMSGTSMAAPHISGMTALLAEYIRSNDLHNKTGLSVRHLAQSLLMSTAQPLLEEDAGGQYYSILAQGAGLARVDLAASAESYILVDGMADGKVKVELGEDARRSGVYTFRFSIHNISGKPMTYDLRADLFTQDLFVGINGDTYLDNWTRPLPANARFSVNGNTPVSQVTVPAGGTTSVEVRLELTAQTRSLLNDNYPTGAYIEGFVFAEPDTDSEGIQGVIHSIPILGYYGSWTESSMYDVGSYPEYLAENAPRTPYLYHSNGYESNFVTISYGSREEYLFGGNPFVQEDTYLPQRNAFNNRNGWTLQSLHYSLIRNAAASMLLLENADTGEQYLVQDQGMAESAYYYVNMGTWQNTRNKLSLGLDLAGLPEGTRLNLSLVSAPELYCTYHTATQSYLADWNALADGAYLTTSFTIDNTAPQIQKVESISSNRLRITAKDSQYIAAVALLTPSGDTILTAAAANQTEPGKVMTVDLDLSNVYGNEFLLAVYDYAENAAVCNVTLELDNQRPYFTIVDRDSGSGMYKGMNSDGSTVNLAAVSGRTMPQAGEYAEGAVFEISEDHKLYAAYDSDLYGFTCLSKLDPDNQWQIKTFLDLAYNRSDGKLYSLFYSRLNNQTVPYLCTIDPFTGVMTVLGTMPIDALNLAIDGSGNFYSTIYGYSQLYRYRSDVISTRSTTLVGQTNGYRTMDTSPLTWDHNSGQLYWAYNDGDTSALIRLNTSTARPEFICDYGFAARGLYVAYEPTSNRFAPTQNIQAISMTSSVQTLVGHTVQLTPQFHPWTVSNKALTWTSSNPGVASVDENGLIQGLSKGTAVITATSALDKYLTASCTVTVSELNTELKALVWDQDGQVWWSSFRANTLPSYNKLCATNLPLNATMVAEGKLYASSLDLNAGTSELYCVNPDTYEMTRIGSSSYFAYLDMAYAPSLGCGMAVCLDYVVQIDLQTGEYSSYQSWGEYLSGDLVGISYYGTEKDSVTQANVDYFLILDSNGNVYLDGWSRTGSKVEYYGGPEASYIGNIGAPVDTNCYQGFHYDGNFAYWTRFNEADNVVELIAFDCNGSGASYSLGYFEDGVWPVGGLYTDSQFSGEAPKPSVSFTDIQPERYYYHAVLWAVEKGITVGTSDTTFEPEGLCTRAQVVTFLWRAMGKPAPVSQHNPFTDVSPERYYYEAVLWAVEKGITVGTTNTTFDPNEECTRAQVVTFLWRTMGKPTPSSLNNPFRDVDLNRFYGKAVLWAVENGITVGLGNGIFGVEDTCTRGQVVTFLHRTLVD